MSDAQAVERAMQRSLGPMAFVVSTSPGRHRRAVGSLLEAREIVEDARRAVGGRTLPEAGGSYGPLSDGTTVTVKPTRWENLQALCGPAGARRSMRRDEILFLFNERHSDTTTYVFRMRQSFGSSGAGGTPGVHVVHRADCPTLRSSTHSKPFPGGLRTTSVKALLNVELCGRCRPDHDELTQQAMERDAGDA